MWNFSFSMVNNIDNLYLDNEPRHFWKFLEADLTQEDWEDSYKDSWCNLNQIESFSGSILSILSHSLGEAQFGVNHWSLSPLQRIYYLIKPFFPRPLAVKLRQYHRFKQETKFPLGWPIEERYVRLQFEVASKILKDKNLAQIPCLGFWPNHNRCELVLTHDVETLQGQDFVRTLADLEQEYGFRSSFNFILFRGNSERCDQV